MAKVIYQGLQSCLHHEQTQQLRFKLSVSSPKPPEFEKCNNGDKKPDSSHYSFLQNLCFSKIEEEETKPYVHPSMAIKRNLSEKSLEICTENLGSENGSDDHHVFDESTFSKIEQQSTTPRAVNNYNKKTIRSVTDFPPPLTTISGSSSLFIRSHREDGRLIVEAVKVPSSRPSVFKAERSDGRLRLCFNRDGVDSAFDQSTDEDEAENEHVYSDDEEEEMEGQDGNYMEVGGQNCRNFHQRSLINNGRCNEVGECESKHNLIRWGVAISIS